MKKIYIWMPVFMMLIYIGVSAQNPGKKKAALDNFFNNEHKMNKQGKEIPFHYIWEDEEYSGYSELGKILTSLGAEILTLREAPSQANLNDIDLYIIVDPDTPKENPQPEYIDEKSIQTIVKWVEAGGVLCLFGNDAGNCEFENFNKLSTKFGIRFNEDLRNPVEDHKYDMGKFEILPNHPVFKNVKKLFLKEISTLKLQDSAKPVLTEGGDIIMACAEYGKGFVFAVGDPWIYNEYIDNRKLPAGFTNKTAAENLFRWLLGKSAVNKN